MFVCKQNKNLWLLLVTIKRKIKRIFELTRCSPIGIGHRRCTHRRVRNLRTGVRHTENLVLSIEQRFTFQRGHVKGYHISKFVQYSDFT